MNSPMPMRIMNPLPRHLAVTKNTDFHRSRYRSVLEMSPRSLQFQRDSERKVTPPVVRNISRGIRTAPMPKMTNLRKKVGAQPPQLSSTASGRKEENPRRLRDVC
ncbi:hypothetical protein BDV98DRAFT_570520 [Pterulicium gracile]|uniref:Uncharacterized protein n=1 Tax=Pterulicium gracile TaxID=1884261 RepID=A0A5C3QIF5_9AGAR|nr:hypothetical protein BDV98DRAFT_570520 [Pterula gracilis]